jgi:hypothetical protein
MTARGNHYVTMIRTTLYCMQMPTSDLTMLCDGTFYDFSLSLIKKNRRFFHLIAAPIGK